MSRTLHFLVAGDPDRPTGGSRYNRRMARELSALGWDVRLQALYGAFPDGAEVGAALQAALVAVPDGESVLIDGLAYGTFPQIAAQHAQRVALLPLVHLPLADETGLSAERSAALFALEHEALRYARRIIGTSAYTAQRLRDFDVEASRLIVAEPGTEPAPLSRGSSGAELRLLCIASVTPRKGQDVLIEALAMLRDLPWQCRCVGGLSDAPAYATQVQQRVRELGLQERIVFTGPQDEAQVAHEYTQADLFVLPSRMDTYGMVLTEALARGLPLIATRTGAIPDTVPIGAGVLVPPDDAPALAAALRELIEHASARDALRQAALRARENIVTWPQAATKLAQGLSAL